MWQHYAAKSAVAGGDNPDAQVELIAPIRMRTIVLISCGKSKRSERCQAQHLYIGDLFQKSLAYARRIGADAIFILSAKHGLLELTQEIAPYEITLNGMPALEAARWADTVLERLRSHSDFTTDRFVLLAGMVYRSRLVPHLTNVELPLHGLRFGEQLKFLKPVSARTE